MRYHFKCENGWQGAPCGIVLFENRYHLFYLTNPEANRYGNICWGHAVSDDLMTWEELPLALPSECMSGSAIVSDGRIWLFYTASDGKSIYAAYSEDGVNFKKASSNPVAVPPEGKEYSVFRDPYVFSHDRKYFMVIGAGAEGVGKVLLYESDDLVTWEYKSELLSDSKYGTAIESPMIFPVEDTWVMVIQSQYHMPSRVLFATGEFTGESFVFDDSADPFFAIETRDEFLNPVSMGDDEGRRMIIAWMFSTRLGTGMLSALREITLDMSGKLAMIPAPEIKPHCISDSRFVTYDKGILSIRFEGRTLFEKQYAHEPELCVLEDTETVEVFISGGRENISMVIC